MSTAASRTEPCLLARLDFLDGIAPDGVAAVSAAARLDLVSRNARIFEQGGVAMRAYALTEGSVRLVQTGRDGSQTIVRFIARGALFGTVPLFTDHRFPADAIAATRSRVLSWSEADFFALIGRYPRIAINIIRVIGARLAEVQNRVHELATARAEQRIAHSLLRLASQAGQDAAGATTIGIPLRRRDLAEISGTTLYTASRTLAAWQKAGLLASRERRLTIRDLPAIARIAGDGERREKPEPRT